jgi:general secretion pathway protein K
MDKDLTLQQYTKNEKGFALILVLMVVGALSVLILDMNYSTRVNLHLAENFRDETQAVFLAQGSVEAAKALLLEDQDSAYDALVGEDDAIWATPNEHQEAGGSIKIKFTIVDEDGKLWIYDLFKVQGPPSTTAQTILDNLENQLDLDQGVFDTIQDWIDDDNNPMPYGAENDDHYQNLDPPYEAANGELMDLSELLLVKDVSDKLYHGRNTAFAAGLKDLFTTYNNGKKGKVNVNTAHPEVLTALVDKVFAEDVEQEIPIETVNNIPGWSGLPKNIKNMLDVKSAYFSVHVWVQVNKVSKTLHTVLQRDWSHDKVTVEYWREM